VAGSYYNTRVAMPFRAFVVSGGTFFDIHSPSPFPQGTKGMAINSFGEVAGKTNRLWVAENLSQPSNHNPCGHRDNPLLGLRESARARLPPAARNGCAAKRLSSSAWGVSPMPR